MKLAIVSDIHGNITGMKAVLRAIEHLGGADKLICAGDTVTASSGSADLMELLFSHSAEMIRGNAEAFLSDPEGNITNVQPGFQPYMVAWYAWLKEWLSAAQWNALVQSPMTRRYHFPNGKSVLVCHATPLNVWARVCGPQVSKKVLNEAFGGYPHEAVVYGHYHHHHVMRLDEKLLVNAASVGLRKDGMSHFTILEDSADSLVVKQYAVPYDIAEERRLNDECGVPIL